MADSEDFKVGDIVMLKSGGPEMTVANAEPGKELWCVWFPTPLHDKPASVSFKPATVRKSRTGTTGRSDPYTDE
jgi:uncharacterized protein YodC (DUF2158 family)